MIAVVVGHDRAGQTEKAAVPQKRRDDPLARIEAPGAARAGVDEDRAAVGHLGDDGVALADVEHRHAQPSVGRPHERPRPGAEGDGEQDRGGEGPPEDQERQPPDVAGHRERRGSRQMHDGAGHRGGQRHDPAQRQQQGPHRVERHRRDRLAEEREGDRHEAQDGRGARERDHTEVGDEAHRRELVEVRERDRQDRELRGGARAERAEHDTSGQRRHDDSEGGGERELEARIEKVARPDGEDRQRGERQAVRHRRVALEQHRGQHQYGHDRGAQDRRLGPDDQREPDHDDDRDDRGEPPAHACEAAQRPDRGGEQRHVEARDGQHVVHAGAPEGLVDVRWQAGALAEQQASEQRGRRRRQRVPDGRDRLALHPRRPRRRWIVERRDRLGPRAPGTRRSQTSPGCGSPWPDEAAAVRRSAGPR